MLTYNTSIEELVREADYQFQGANPVVTQLIREIEVMEEMPDVWYTEEEYQDAVGDVQDDLDKEIRLREEVVEAWDDLVWDMLNKLKHIQESIPALATDLNEFQDRFYKLRNIG